MWQLYKVNDKSISPNECNDSLYKKILHRLPFQKIMIKKWINIKKINKYFKHITII